MIDFMYNFDILYKDSNIKGFRVLALQANSISILAHVIFAIIQK